METLQIEEEETMSVRFRKNTTCRGGFQKVAGMSGLKQTLRRDFIDILFYKDLAKAYKITPPNGILLYGPPGVGKTFLAQALAEESGIDYAFFKPSDFACSHLHGSQKLIRDAFEEASRHSPCLMIIDEVDALVPKRGSSASHYKEEEINEWLVQLNNSAERGIYVVAMTNHPETIDKAILRKGRIEQCFFVPAPDTTTRMALFDLSLKGRLRTSNIDTMRLAKLTSNFTSSDITFVVHEAARFCFEKTIHDLHCRRIRISQKILEDTIANTVPSISADDIERYNKIKMEVDNKREVVHRRQKIGF